MIIEEHKHQYIYTYANIMTGGVARFIDVKGKQ
jgi:hypothetical protein